ncbi:hypothetical protein [Paenibacillus xerothermodurans]|uniref:Lipoprotein n=1 Tax=Paenibacillus xerothermodurans TaxID=1977292 RepID=A0A2W1N921_PAEXE|nr:hypothetical protein [Paenibacillus xerothermodurans]PZE20897.1 hypothetical protein CBW46_009370 [Paenibacillus xerothermodurans]
MKRQLLTVLLIAVVLVTICSGCGNRNTSDANPSNAEFADLTPKALETFYPGDITKVDAIEMFDGSSGNRKTFTEPAKIQEWIEKVRHVKLVPDPDQEDSAGVLYHVTLFETEGKKMIFTPTHVDNKPVKPSSELADLMTELYESST